MNGQPPPGPPPKYKIASPSEEAGPKRVTMPPPPKLRSSQRATLFRVLIVLVSLASITVAYWSFFQQLQPLQRESRTMLTRVTKMAEQMDQAERRWPPDQVKEIRARYREVCHQLFADQNDLQEWLRLMQASAVPLALDLQVRLGESVPQSAFTNNLAVVPAAMALEILPAPGDANGKTRYERVLAFGRQLAAYGKRADLAELSVVGGADSISRALLVLNLWTGDLGGDAELATNAPNPTAITQ
jgi:hypothetical protein